MDPVDEALNEDLNAAEDEGGLDAALAEAGERAVHRAYTGPRRVPIPLYDRVIVKQDAEVKMMGGGMLHVADQQAEKPQEGVVLWVGTGKILENGTQIPMTVQVGDRVAFGKFSGAPILINGDEFKILREDEIMVVLVLEPEQEPADPNLP